MDLDERLQRLLASGHPETDGYDPPALDLTRLPRHRPRDARLLSMLVAGLAVALIAGAAVAGGFALPSPTRPSTSDLASLRATDSLAPPSSRASTQSPPAHLAEIVVVDRPSDVTNDKVLSDGLFECVVRKVIDIPGDVGAELEARIAASGVEDGWLTPGVEWIGTSRPEVASAFGAYWAAMPTKPGPPLELLAEVDGRTTWKTINRVRTHDHIVWREGSRLVEVPCGEPTSVELTASPELRMMNLMSNVGSSCFVGADALRIPLDPSDLDRRIDRAGIVEGWLSVLHLWVGSDPRGLTRALAASWAGIDGHDPDIWVLTTEQDATYGHRWVPIVTPAGRTVWQSWDYTATCPTR